MVTNSWNFVSFMLVSAMTASDPSNSLTSSKGRLMAKLSLLHPRSAEEGFDYA
jgi:hypothetical protein